MEWNGIEQRGMGRMHSSCCWRGCGASVLLRQSVRHDTTRGHVISIQITLSLHVPCLRVVSFVFYKQARVHEEMQKHVCAIEYSPSQERTLHVVLPSNEFAESAKNLEARNELNRLKREANHSAASELLKWIFYRKPTVAYLSVAIDNRPKYNRKGIRRNDGRDKETIDSSDGGISYVKYHWQCWG